MAYPPPARCWLALSNDPDNTTIEAWEELHKTIWSDLELPFEDSLFVANHSDVLPDQVNLESFPKILSAHRHDTIHTWGDYTNSKSHVFTRADAQKCLEILNQHNFAPRVWTDHANFSGNLMHRVSVRPVPRITDASGNELYSALHQCVDSNNWGLDEASAWWKEHTEQIREFRAKRQSELGVGSAQTIAVAIRERIES